MMRILLFMLCLAAGVSEAAAQAGALSVRANAAAPVPPEGVPGFTRATPGCLMPGVPFTVEGNHLLAWKEKNPVLLDGNTRIELEVLQHHDTRYVMRLASADSIRQGNKYRMAIEDPLRPRQLEETAMTLYFCPIAAALFRGRDILILLRAAERPKLLGWLREHALTPSREYALKSLGEVMVVLPSSADAEATLKALRRDFPDADVDWDDDLSAASQPRTYAARAIGWPDDKSCTGKISRLSLGLLDGRVDTEHPALRGRDIRSQNFLEDGLTADTAHATAIASILVGNAPQQGLDGLLPGNNLYVATVLREEKGKQLARVHSVVRGLDWLMDNKLRLIGVSLATTTKNAVLIRAFDAAAQRGAIIFAAAGNDGMRAPAWPAALEKTIAVTAVDAKNRLFAKANHGSYIDFAAPGVDIWVASAKDGVYQSGTSLAVPYVMAVAAVALGVNPAQSRDVLYSQIERHATRLDGGALLINASTLCPAQNSPR